MVTGLPIHDEICQGGNFEPQCPNQALVLIESARVGRMKYGKCVTEETGPIGCSENVEGYIDSECFGNSIYVPDRELMAANPCSALYSVYLEVSYECIEGKHPCNFFTY